MKRIDTLAAIGLTLIYSLTSAAQEIPVDVVSGTEAETGLAPRQTADIIAPTDTATSAPTNQTEQLSEGEQRIRAGIVMLGNLHNILAGIQDNDTAEKAVAPLVRLCNELNLWAQSFTTLPPMNETEQAVCEDTYLPIIKKINYSIKVQGERLAAAEYYGSMNLPTVLVRLAILNQ